MKIGFYILLLLLLGSCARPVAPTGGPIDHTPPKILQQLSTPNFQTHFTANTFELSFNEWVVLDKIEQNTLVSPQLANKPKISLKGKTLKFEFAKDEELKPNTTYIVNFGNSVRDFTEGNILKDLKFVFSTGDAIDSGSVKAQVLQFKDQKPLVGILVMLYESNEDSLLYKHIPDYIGRTDSSGNVTLDYLREGVYNIYALKDLNFNSKLDLTDEEAAYSEEKVHVPGQEKVILNLFPKDIPPKIVKVDSVSNGRLRLITDANTDGWQVSEWGKNPPAFIRIDEKQIDLYTQDTSGRISFILHRPLVPNDTFDLKMRGPSRGPRYHFSIEEFEGLKSDKMRSIALRISAVLSQVDTGRFQIFEGKSLKKMSYSAQIDSIYPAILHILSDWKVDSTYLIKVGAGDLTDIRGVQNPDSITYQFKINDPEVLSSISVQIDSLNPAYQYIIRIVKQGNTIVKWVAADTSSFFNKIAGLMSGDYELKIGEDVNKNGRIDGGDFNKRQLPERVFSRKLEPLRENWSVEAVIDMREFK